MLKSKRPIDTYYKLMMCKLWVLLCARIPVGNLAETGVIVFMTRNFQSSTYLKTDRWKPHKVPPTLASSKKSQHTCCLLIALCNFFLPRSFCNLSLYCCLSVVFNNSFSFFSFPFFLQIFLSIYLFRYSFCLWEPDFTILNYLYQYIHYKFTTNKLYSRYDHSSTTSKTERVFR